MKTGEYPDDWDRRRKKILERDGHECQKCGSTSNLEVDHIVPISQGGGHGSDNLQTLCHDCHAQKHPVQTKLRKGIAENRRIRMKYHSSSGTRVRKVNPYGIGMYEGVQYFVGYDHYRNQRRYFRPKKVEWMDVTDESFSPPDDFDVDEYLAQKVTSRKSDCFIATAAYGTSTADEIDLLRDFRDDVLGEYSLGRNLIELYYFISPPIAQWIAHSERRKEVTRRVFVDPCVRLVAYYESESSNSESE
jgi:hypothetical protein